MGYMKGQAMMEYLMTYGVALFAILIVLGVLVAVVWPNLQPPEVCRFEQPGFTCGDKSHAVYNEAGTTKVSFELSNQEGKGVQLVAIKCLENSPANVQKADVDVAVNGSDKNLNAGASRQFTLDCYKTATDKSSAAEGSVFKGTIAVKYKFTDEVSGAPERLAVATLTGKVSNK